ncbi:hypothetical protein BJ508DRAFT_328426 [Ascobolus immersus RN42]|uniref:Uncharacterized protein n=1 Tax=Ascobolus immersus RN42 TaxID=1160509 RepID=A0A3N4HZS9_ASCIM|nr:hypothetical protein BJ508DRAFT_328426 [Ascobolus immersus RN42]
METHGTSSPDFEAWRTQESSRILSTPHYNRQKLDSPPTPTPKPSAPTIFPLTIPTPATVESTIATILSRPLPPGCLHHYTLLLLLSTPKTQTQTQLELHLDAQPHLIASRLRTLGLTCVFLLRKQTRKPPVARTLPPLEELVAPGPRRVRSLRLSEEQLAEYRFVVTIPVARVDGKGWEGPVEIEMPGSQRLPVEVVRGLVGLGVEARFSAVKTGVSPAARERFNRRDAVGRPDGKVVVFRKPKRREVRKQREEKKERVESGEKKRAKIEEVPVVIKTEERKRQWSEEGEIMVKLEWGCMHCDGCGLRSAEYFTGSGEKGRHYFRKGMIIVC